MPGSKAKLSDACAEVPSTRAAEPAAGDVSVRRKEPPGGRIVSRKRRKRRERALFWEQLCKRCGACCFEKREGSFFRMYTDYTAPCEYLDTQTMRCTVYEHRFEICPDCRRMTIFHALFAGYLPETCGYVEYFRSRNKRRKTRP